MTVYYVNLSFYELLDKDGSFTIHQRNVQSLAIEIHKHLHGLSPAILSKLSKVFKVNEIIPYDLRMRNALFHMKTTVGLEYFVNDCSSLLCFKKHIRKWKPKSPCRLNAKYFCDMLVLYSSAAVLPSQLSV